MKRQAIVLSSILAILLLAVFFVRRSHNVNEGGQQKKLFNLESDSIAAFEINQFTQGLYFSKEGENWVVQKLKTDLTESIEAESETSPTTPKKKKVGKSPDTNESPVPADPVKISSLLANLTTLKTGEPVATEKVSVSKFQINPHSLHAILYGKDGRELDRFYVGKMGPDFMSSFVKKGAFGTGSAQENLVYLVNENLQGLMSYSYEQWLLPENTDGIAKEGISPAPAKKAKLPKAGQKGSAHATSKNKKNR